MPPMAGAHSPRSTEAAARFAGSYKNPACGVMDVLNADASTISSLEANTASEDPGPRIPHPAILCVKPTERTWPNRYALRQTSQLSFHMDVFFQSGSDDNSTNEAGNNVTNTRSLAYKSIKVLEYL